MEGRARRGKSEMGQETPGQGSRQDGGKGIKPILEGACDSYGLGRTGRAPSPSGSLHVGQIGLAQCFPAAPPAATPANYSAIATAYDAARDATACAAAALTAAARAASAPDPAVVDSGLAMARLPGPAIRQC
mgnify:FL=1